MNINIYQIQEDGSGVLAEFLEIDTDADAMTLLGEKAVDGFTYRAEEQVDSNNSRVIGEVP